MCARVRRNFSRGQQAGARVRKRRREGNEWAARVGRRYTIQRTIRWLKNRCQVGPTILFECPAQIPRSSLRSFSLWARQPLSTNDDDNNCHVRAVFPSLLTN